MPTPDDQRRAQLIPQFVQWVYVVLNMPLEEMISLFERSPNKNVVDNVNQSGEIIYQAPIVDLVKLALMLRTTLTGNANPNAIAYRGFLAEIDKLPEGIPNLLLEADEHMSPVLKNSSWAEIIQLIADWTIEHN